MANLHTVTKHGTTKSGKPVVYFDNRHGFQDMVFLGDTEAPPVGAVVDTDIASSTRDGKTFHFLNGWGLAPNSPPQDHWKPPTTTPANAAPSGPEPVKGYTEPERMFISNICAAAISAGKIEDPVDLPAWVNAALYAIRNATGALPTADWPTPTVGPEPF